MVADGEKERDFDELDLGDSGLESPAPSEEEGGVIEEDLAEIGEDAPAGTEEADGAGGEILEETLEEEGGDVPAELRVSGAEMTESEEGILVKYCIFCKETILADAMACKYCGHVVHIFEGAVFKQLWWFFWAGVITLIGTLLPFYGGKDIGIVSAFRTFPGAFYLVFSILMVFAMSFNIYSRRMVMGHVLLLFVPAIHCWWMVVKAVGGIDGFEWYSFLYKIKALDVLTEKVGSGTILILLGATISSLTFIISLFSALTGGGKKGQGAASSKGRGRSRSRGRSR